MVCLLSQVFVYAHLLLVRHETCPDHGEIVDSTADSQTTATSGSESSDHRAAVWIYAGSRSTHGHGHCSFGLQRREQLAVILPGGALLLPPPEVLHCPALTADAPPPRIALFRTAPKQSPPA